MKQKNPPCPIDDFTAYCRNRFDLADIKSEVINPKSDIYEFTLTFHHPNGNCLSYYVLRDFINNCDAHGVEIDFAARSINFRCCMRDFYIRNTSLLRYSYWTF